jgi:hypothetical protein
MAVDATAPFTWGAGGARMTPEEIAAQRKVAQEMIKQGADYSPIQSWSQGASRVAQALLGGFESREADQASKANASSEAALLTSLLSGGAPASVAPTAAPVSLRTGALVPNDSNAIPGTVGMDQRLADRVQDFIQDNPGAS